MSQNVASDLFATIQAVFRHMNQEVVKWTFKLSGQVW